MVQSYLPTILIVVISWVSFWMDVDSVAGRTTLGVTTLLTVSSKASGIRQQRSKKKCKPTSIDFYIADVQAEVPLVSYVKVRANFSVWNSTMLFWPFEINGFQFKKGLWLSRLSKGMVFKMDLHVI